MSTHLSFIDKKRISELLNVKYPGYLSALLYGSYAKGTQRCDSDIDLLVIRNNEIKPYRELFAVDGSVYDVSVHSLDTLHSMLSASERMANFSLALILKDAIPIPEQTGAVSVLKQKARELLNSPINKNSAAFRVYLTGLLDDLRHATAWDERMWLLIETYRALTDYALFQNGMRTFKRKHAFLALEEVASGKVGKLNAVLEMSLVQKDITYLLQHAEKFLEQIGGPLKDGFKRPIGMATGLGQMPSGRATKRS